MSHKCFASYHAADKKAVDDFCEKVGGSFIRRGVKMEEDIADSEDTDYVMRRIRELYLQDSTVTIVLIGKCTWARRFVDWKVQAFLRQPKDEYPNGLVAIQLWDSYSILPDRVKLNVDSGYAKFYKYPKSSTSLANMIDEAWNAWFDKANLIKNPGERYS
ncbi:MAG: TIR domain-containing protein [Planctomycetota bacterium]